MIKRILAFYKISDHLVLCCFSCLFALFVVQPISLLLPQSWCGTRGLYLFTRRVQTVSCCPVFDVWFFCLWCSPFCAGWCTWASRTCPRSPTTSSSSPAGQLSACTLRWRTSAGCMHFEVEDKCRLHALSGRGKVQIACTLR